MKKLNIIILGLLFLVQVCLASQSDVAYYIVQMPSGKQERFETLTDYIACKESWQNWAELEGDTQEGWRAQAYYDQLPSSADVFAWNYQTQRETQAGCNQYYRDKAVLDAYLRYTAGRQ